MIFPISSSTCKCYDYFGMNCVAWCTSLPVSGFEIRSSSGSGLSPFSISCSSGKQALGCHIQTTGSQSEQWRRNYPVTSGTSCTCYDYYGANCFASCGAITNYEVVSVKSSGTFSVSCSDPANRVLGCGLNPDGSPGTEWFRYARVISATTCQCYDYYGTRCYAACGKIW